jgi:hypothetical protein
MLNDVYIVNCELVFKRPFSEEFMKFCLERFEVGIWTSAQELVINIFLIIFFYFD